MLRALTPVLLLSLLSLLLLPVACSPPLDWRRQWKEKRTGKLMNNNWGQQRVCTLGQGGTVTEGSDLVIKTHESNCTMKRCLNSGQILTIDVQCPALPCVNPQLKAGACCKHCKDKEVNCRLPDGKLIKGEDSVTFDNQLCRCPRSHGRGQKTRPAWGQVDLTVAECYPITTLAPTTTTPVPHCRLPERRREEKKEEMEAEDTSGELLEPGKERIVPKGNDCRKYVCDARGQLTTYYSQCPRLNCSTGTAIRRQGDCCKSCPGDPEVTSDPANYTKSLPITEQKKNIAFHIINFLRLLFGNNFFGPKTHHKSHHRHQHHHNAMAGSDVKGWKGTTSNWAKKEDGAVKTEAGKGANSKNGKKHSFFVIVRFGGSGRRGGGGGKRWGGGHHMRNQHRWSHHKRGHGGHWG